MDSIKTLIINDLQNETRVMAQIVSFFDIFTVRHGPGHDPAVHRYFLSLLCDPIFFHQIIQSRTADAQVHGGWGDAATVLFEGGLDHFPFQVFPGVFHVGRGRGSSCRS